MVLTSSGGTILLVFSGIISGILAAQAMPIPDTTMVIFAIFPVASVWRRIESPSTCPAVLNRT
jgi:hypothetical protein